MVIFKERLPNGNIFIWLGTGATWKKSESGIDNALFLTGGDVLLFKTAISISLHDEEIVEDFKTLDYSTFCKKHSIEDMNYELWKEIKQGLEIEKYPILKNVATEVNDYEIMIRKYLFNLNLDQLVKLKIELDNKIFEENKKFKN